MSLSFETMMIESTLFLSSAIPAAALEDRRLPSKVNGRVTIATVNAPLSLHALATIGAAPVPVPPPSPHAIKTISYPSIISLILSIESKAACFPVSGSPPAPKPFVTCSPRTNLLADFEVAKA